MADQHDVVEAFIFNDAEHVGDMQREIDARVQLVRALAEAGEGGRETLWPRERSRSATRRQCQPPPQAPWTRTKVVGSVGTWNPPPRQVRFLVFFCCI